MKRILSVIVILILIFTFLSSCAETVVPLTVSELLELGEKYLLELNYEQALIYFLEALKIDPTNLNGYIGAAESYINLGQSDNAIEILNVGLRHVKNDDDLLKVQYMLDSLHTTELKTQEYEQDEIQVNTDENLITQEKDSTPEMLVLLSDLLALYSENSFDTVYDIYENPDFHELNVHVHEYPVIKVNDNGNFGIGLYRKGLYIGEYKDSQRSGHGDWIYFTSFPYRFVGEWENDMPNGLGVLYTVHGHEVYVDSIHEGLLINGLWDGNVIEKGPAVTESYPDISFFTRVYVNGKCVVLGEALISDDGVTRYPTGYVENDIKRLSHYIDANILEWVFGIWGCWM